MNASGEKQALALALAQVSIDPAIAGRDYQINAVRAVLEGMAQKKRHFLLVMATGTGKTRTSIALVDTLLRAGLAEKVLFLVDRIALREQALAAFKEHLPNEPRWPHIGEKCIATDRRIYVATHPAMRNIIRDEAHPLPPDFFDVVVVDESHRSIYNTYGAVLDYFNAITVGLTATPTESIDHNTFALFHCEGGIPTFTYSYEEAVNNTPPYLCDFQAKKIHAIPSFAIRSNRRPLSLAAQRQQLQQGQEVEEIDCNGTPVGACMASEGINTRIIREFMEKAIKDANGVLPGKTIFFCASKAHARRLQDCFDTLYPHYRGALAKVLVSDDPQVYGKGGLLDQFTHNDMPRIAISVDMLDTGIDVREIVNLVFAKPVYSYTKFWQMLGRGTRLLDKPKPWCREKAGFLVLDCWDNFEYFKLDPTAKALKPQIPLPVRLVGLRLDKIAKAKDSGHTAIAQREIAKLRLQIAALPTDSVAIQEAATVLVVLEDADFWSDLHPDRLAFLRATIQPLFSAVWEGDFKAMRFECALLEYALAVWNEDQQQAETLQKGIVQQISALPLSIRFVEQEAPLIRAAQSPHYWAKADEDTLEELLTQLGPLMQFGADDTAQEYTLLDRVDGLYKQEGVASGPRHAAVRDVFAAFLCAHPTLDSRQRAFLALLQDFLIAREKIEKKDLITAPFTIIHPQGIRGVFSPDEINEILPLTERLAA